jgi:uncharacterized protein (TIGR02145 family)
MKKYNFITAILFFGLLSCSNEETKTQNQIAARPTVPIQNGEVRIGNQIWMTKNLNVSRYRNGDPIPQVTDPTQWENLTTGAWCYYRNITANGLVYGKLYNWYAVNDPRGLAPLGYHLPSDAEWTALVAYLGFANVAGGKMKSTGTIQAGTGLWQSPNTGATNESGFNGPPGGYRNINGNFSFIGNYGFWWSSTENGIAGAWYRYLSDIYGVARRNYYNKEFGFSVRCVRD